MNEEKCLHPDAELSLNASRKCLRTHGCHGKIYVLLVIIINTLQMNHKVEKNTDILFIDEDASFKCFVFSNLR